MSNYLPTQAWAGHPFGRVAESERERQNMLAQGQAWHPIEIKT
jgi:hypothetical protein